jgi:4-O-beta-D-mannosyl-D-glucose phosphorylase
MTKATIYATRRASVEREHEELLARRNEPVLPGNGIFNRYKYPILTSDHAPLTWRYDFDPASNPFFMERLGVNVTFNAGAIKLGDDHILIVRVEGWNRKSFFALARSKDGIHNWRFDAEPILTPETSNPDTNIYDTRLTAHEDGWIYGIFCSERRDPAAPQNDTSSAVAAAGIMRSRDLRNWERLPDLVTKGSQQRNVVLHPEYVNGKYMLYTRPQGGFIDTGSGGGICWGLSHSMCPAKVDEEILMDAKAYHTIKEVKNGAGATPIKTPNGWLHVVHGVRNTAAGLRYVVYALLSDLKAPGTVIAAPGGYLIAPMGDERVGDVSNVIFCNGAIADRDRLLIYYASSDTRMHVAETSIEQMLDYCLHTPPDRGRSYTSVEDRLKLIRANAAYLASEKERP